jgi:hypothetical protein
MSYEEQSLEIDVKSWDMGANTFVVEGINFKLDEIFKSQRKIRLLILKQDENNWIQLKDVIIKGRHELVLMSKLEVGFGKSSSHETEYVYEEKND